MIISLLSCGQNSSEKRLNGKWYENEYNIWHFFPDSLVFPNLGEKHEWQASESKIRFDLITYIGNQHEKKIDYEDKIIIDYKTNKNNDSLFGTLKNKYGNHKFSLIKAENYIDYLNKKYGIKFSLPKDNSIELLKINKNHGLKVFIGYINDKIVGKTELSDNLNNLETDIITFKNSIIPNGEPELEKYDQFYNSRFHLKVFADKNISDSIITKYLSATIKIDISKKYDFHLVKSKDTLPIRIFRIYNNKEEINPWNLKGKKIKTIANNVYN